MGKEPAIKSRFRSKSEHTLDPKGRLNFPSRFKDVLQHYGSETLMVTSWGEDLRGGQHLRVYPASEWQLFEDQLLAQRHEVSDLSGIIRQLISGVTECSLDKQGRLLIPSPLRAEVGIERDVVLSGMLEFVEIWDLKSWEREYSKTRNNLAQYGDSLAKLGIF